MDEVSKTCNICGLLNPGSLSIIEKPSKICDICSITRISPDVEERNSNTDYSHIFDVEEDASNTSSDDKPKEILFDG